MKNEKTISSQVFSKNGWNFIQKIKVKNNYYAEIKCENCNSKKQVNYYNFMDLSKNTRKCVNCTKKNWALSIIGNIYGSIYIIDFDHIGEKNNHGHIPIYFKVRCTKCEKESIRLYNKSQWEASTKCKFCTTGFTEPSYNNIHNVYKQGARDRNIEWDLPDKIFLQLITANCFYCGTKPTIRKHDSSKNKKEVNGIDRVDSKKKYSENNCVSCCSVCNYMKQTLSYDNFISQIKKIYEIYLENKGSTTISKESTTQANGVGKGGLPGLQEEDIV